MSRSTLALWLALCTTAAPLAAQTPRAPIDTTWRRGGVCYEIFVRSFYDSDGDGIGDLNGLTQKLDYVNDGDPRSTRSLGARCIWLMPIAASPSYHGYDVKNYYRVNPEYGSNADLKRLVAQAHRRGIRVLVDLVLNHASSEHPYFKEALRDTASPHRSWFRFSPTNPNATGPWGQQLWHKSPVRDEYYYGIFTPEMPDLNYENPAVRAEAASIARFWLTEMGVDGFRLDAVPYLVEEGGAVANTRGTHDVLREFSAAVRRTAPGAYTVGEVWDSIGTVLPYYPDQLDGYFSFALSDALLAAVSTASASGLLPPFVRMQQAMPATRWSPFLRNHDQTRTVTALGGDVAAARLAAELLLTLPGLPFVYYGEEIGMSGDKPDERLRTPMQWTRGRAAGFTRGAAWEPLQPDSLRANVAIQDTDAGSLLNAYRRLIHLRSSNTALASGELVPLQASDPAVATYLRRDGANVVLVVANLGKTPLSGVTISSTDRPIPIARYSATDLLTGAAASPLNVGEDGRLRAYAPLSTLSARRTYVLELRKIPR
ncbi:MAG: alpha amylase catalytic region [Gemmatimonadetes bacterium]|nr:alpha amylase catalytic region [Gemmatimonadota bacterium]